MDLTEVRQALADVISTTGLRTYQYVPENVNPPCAVIEFPDQIAFDMAMGKGLDQYDISIIVLVSSASDRAGQKALEAYASGSGQFSIREAVWNNRNLNDTCADARVTQLTDFGNRSYGNANYIQFKANVTIYGRG